jgi:hypothetical protein
MLIVFLVIISIILLNGNLSLFKRLRFRHIKKQCNFQMMSSNLIRKISLDSQVRNESCKQMTNLDGN